MYLYLNYQWRAMKKFIFLLSLGPYTSSLNRKAALQFGSQQPSPGTTYKTSSMLTKCLLFSGTCLMLGTMNSEMFSETFFLDFDFFFSLFAFSLSFFFVFFAISTPILSAFLFSPKHLFAYL